MFIGQVFENPVFGNRTPRVKRDEVVVVGADDGRDLGKFGNDQEAVQHAQMRLGLGDGKNDERLVVQPSRLELLPGDTVAIGLGGGAPPDLVEYATTVNDVAILPVDSEPNALHQCLRGSSLDDVRRLVLTASGGPFRETNQNT